MTNKKAFEMSFSTIFAIIVGAVVLFLAIYATAKFIGTRRYEIDMQTAAKLSIILDPLETSLESGKKSVISLSSETRVYNDKCNTYGSFGSQRIGVSVSSGFGGKYQKPAYGKEQYNKYIFSEEIAEGKEFGVFIKPLTLPFKVSDLVILSAGEYCFVQALEDIENEVKGLGLGGINFTDSKTECPKTSEIICFESSSGCNISVYGDMESGKVEKNGKTMYYIDSLIYAAIFSSPEIYECNIKRLTMRLSNLALIYTDKIEVVRRMGCDSTLDMLLISLANEASSADSSQDLFSIQDKADEIGIINSAASCSIFV